MPVANLREAINILDPERSLHTDADLKKFFVERPYSPIQELCYLLQDTAQPQKVLFTGHRGSGKSSELAKLTHELQDFLCVHYSIRSVLNLFDITYVDVILSLGLQLIKTVTEKKMRINEKLLKHILEFTKEITKETETTIKGNADVGAELNVHVLKLSGKLGTEEVTRTSVREIVSKRLSDLLEYIKDLVKEVERVETKRVLFIIEDLDKTDLGIAKKLFYDHATSLAAPEVSIIYTFPTALRHDNDFIQIRMSFPNVYNLPNIKIKTKDGAISNDGIDKLKQILTKRVRQELFRGESINNLVYLSSGIPRELISIARMACLDARLSGKDYVEDNHVQSAARKSLLDYQVLLTKKQLELLRTIQKTKTVENTEQYRDLLHNLSAIEYRNEFIWYDVHPIILPLLNPKL
jgi:hypothetical protein